MSCRPSSFAPLVGSGVGATQGQVGLAVRRALGTPVAELHAGPPHRTEQESERQDEPRPCEDRVVLLDPFGVAQDHVQREGDAQDDQADHHRVEAVARGFHRLLLRQAEVGDASQDAGQIIFVHGPRGHLDVAVEDGCPPVDEDVDAILVLGDDVVAVFAPLVIDQPAAPIGVETSAGEELTENIVVGVGDVDGGGPSGFKRREHGSVQYFHSRPFQVRRFCVREGTYALYVQNSTRFTDVKR